MPFDARIVECYTTTIEGYAAEASRLLSLFARAGVSLLAFKAVPVEPHGTQFTLVPNDGSRMTAGADKAGLKLDGPHPALLIQGNDESGALSEIYDTLSRANIRPAESSGIADIQGSYGVIFYIGKDDCEKAAAALKG